MTRIPGNAQIAVKPRSDLLTGLLGAACVAMALALMVLVLRSYTIFDGLF